jgi:hypothetical protein
MSPLPRSAGPAIFVLAMSTLALEVALTRVFSVITYYHFTYLIIALALLGFGAAGTVLSVDRRFAGTAFDRRLLADCAWLFGTLVLVCFLSITKINFDPMAIYWHRDYSQLVGLFLLLLLAATPFFAGGLGIGYLVSRSGAAIHRLYLFDLMGAGFGSLAALFAINYLGAPSTIFWIATAACAVAMVLGRGLPGRRWRYPITTVVALALALLTMVDDGAVPVPFPPSKVGDAYLADHRWHVVSRVDVSGPRTDYPAFGGMLSSTYDAPMPPLSVRMMLQDGFAPTGIIGLQGREPNDVPILGYYLQGAPYVMRPQGRALVIGPGGGIDVAIALHYGSPRVTAVDINPWTIDYVRNTYNDFAGGLYRRPDVDVVCAEGRHYLTATDQKFDVIQLSGVDTFAALSFGAYALSENYLYTQEAISDFLDHLTEHGVLSFSRWLFTPPRETLRLAVTARRALEQRGVRDAWKHIFVVAGYRASQSSPWADLLVKLEPFTADEVAALRAWASRLQFDVIYDPLLPYVPGGEYDHLTRTEQFDPGVCAREFDTALRVPEPQLDEYVRNYPYNLTPAVDDSPFFFNFYRIGSLLHPFTETGGGGYMITRLPLGLLILAVCLLQVVGMTALFLVLPMRGRLVALRGGAGVGAVLTYFGCIGLAFIAVEIMLLQKLTVFLGGPVYSMSVTLFSLLVFCGIGSFLAKRVTGDGQRARGTGVLIAVTLAGALTTLALNHLLPHLMGLSQPLRCLVAVLLLLPLGLLMGMPFPTGIRVAERIDPELVPLAWCTNACATVFGSLLAVLVAMFLGFTAVVSGALIVYLIAVPALWIATRPAAV